MPLSAPRAAHRGLEPRRLRSFCVCVEGGGGIFDLAVKGTRGGRLRREVFIWCSAVFSVLSNLCGFFYLKGLVTATSPLPMRALCQQYRVRNDNTHYKAIHRRGVLIMMLIIIIKPILNDINVLEIFNETEQRSGSS